jgi:hypothetical protein
MIAWVREAFGHGFYAALLVVVVLATLLLAWLNGWRDTAKGVLPRLLVVWALVSVPFVLGLRGRGAADAGALRPRPRRGPADRLTRACAPAVGSAGSPCGAGTGRWVPALGGEDARELSSVQADHWRAKPAPLRVGGGVVAGCPQARPAMRRHAGILVCATGRTGRCAREQPSAAASG